MEQNQVRLSKGATMTNLEVVFLLGPLYFFSHLASLGTAESIDTVVFITSAMGTVFWASVLGAIGGLLGQR